MQAIEDGARVAVLAAMQPELRPLRVRLRLREELLGAALCYRGRAGTHELMAAVTAMGTGPATRVATRLVDTFSPDHVMVVGIAGGIDPALQIGDLIDPEQVVDARTGVALHPRRHGAGVPVAKLLTTDTLHNAPEDLRRLREADFAAVDMESAAIGGVAESRGLPWSVYRAISDRAGDPAVDASLVGLANADGSPNPAAIARFLLTGPWRIPKLIELGRGMRGAVRASTRAALAALGVG